VREAFAAVVHANHLTLRTVPATGDDAAPPAEQEGAEA
jgi:hypothetical protein